MKLLSRVTSYIKDGSKAVKRITLGEFRVVADETLTQLLGIATMVVKMFALRREGEHDVLHLWCAHRENVALCSHCGSLSTKAHQEEQRCIRHLDVWGKKTFLHFLSRRFRCEDCGRTFTEELPFVDAHRRQSKALEMQVYQACLSSTRKSVANKVGLSQSTVKEIFNFYAGIKHLSAASHVTRVLGIDEISVKKRHKQFVLVISDIDRKCILAVLSNRDKKTLEDWIDSLSSEERKSIQFVSIDMWKPYSQAARKKLPHAKIVVDRFHVMKQLNSRLTQLRTKYQKESSDEMKKVIKGSRWILVRNRSELSQAQADHLDKILCLCPELRRLYLLKEEFRTIFEKIRYKEKAARFLDAWILKAESTGDKYLRKFVGTFKNWREQILNYFIEGITNGFVEGINNGLRTMIRRAFGFRNFANFRTQALAQFAGFHVNPR